MINIEVLVKVTNNIVIKSQLFDLHTKIKFNKFYVIELGMMEIFQCKCQSSCSSCCYEIKSSITHGLTLFFFFG
jgi:hypothetical protein